MGMFCRQCEQTAGGRGCAIKGVCGKSDDVAGLQDLLIQSLIGVAIYGKGLRGRGDASKNIDRLIIEGLFKTVTNVNFDPEVLEADIRAAETAKERLRFVFERSNFAVLSGTFKRIAEWKAAVSKEELVEQGKNIRLINSLSLHDDIRSLKEVLLYGLKGMAAYADHALILGKDDGDVNAFFYKGLVALADDTLGAEDLVALNMEFGKVNLKCLGLLDSAHTERFGYQEPTSVYLGVKKGPAIIVSGHDLYDLEQLLDQSKDSGVNIYTHGEMITAHAYPKLKSYRNLAGHFGTAWQNQQKEFDNIPACVLMTTNCIQEPRASYKDRIFTTGLVGWPGVPRIDEKNGKKDFSKIIGKAKSLGGFQEDLKEKEIVLGFGHHAILGAAGKIVEAVKAGAIRHFYLIGGCDGAKPGRNYYTEFAEKAPKDTIILTLACGKFRFNRLELGKIGDFPRVLDCGQCNDAYSAIVVASELAKAFNCAVNDLPLSMILSWYEQKAVCILLTLLSLGIKNIRLGPSLPAFVTPNVLNVLVKNFDIKPISTVDEDLGLTLARK